MCKELTRFEIAACKRVAANTKSLRTKVEKIDAKIAELNAMRNTYVSEIKMWENPIVEKYGCSVESILDGSYLNPPMEEVYTEYTECEGCIADESLPNTEYTVEQ